MTAKRVLIVEDDATLLRGLKDNFQAQGYQVRTANDGEKGLEALLRDPPDLVLLDVMLPKVNGYDVCRLARSRQLGTPILMLSAKCRVDDVVRGLALGADEYMTKPFGIRDLLARARRLSQRTDLAEPAARSPGAPASLPAGLGQSRIAGRDSGAQRPRPSKEPTP
jgi:DNA-binding response OmpR family regulator